MVNSCTNCGLAYGHLQGAHEFPSVRLCPTCLQRWFGWMHDSNVMSGNPLVAAFWSGPQWIQIIGPKSGYIKAAVHGFKLMPNNESNKNY